MESLTERFEAGLILEEPSLETNSSPASPSTEAVPDDFEERSATCFHEPDPEFLNGIWEKCMLPRADPTSTRTLTTGSCSIHGRAGCCQAVPKIPLSSSI